MRSVALVHDWLEAPGGGEAVLAELLRIYPRADVFTLVDFLTPAERSKLGIGRPATSALQRFPGARRWFRYAAAIYPKIVERFDLSKYDLIISNSHAVAKGVLKNHEQVHVCYCLTPARFAWTMASTYRERAAGDNRWRAAFTHRALSRFRTWDLAASQRVDHFIANSRHIARTIADCYGREADVVYPPVDVARFGALGRGTHDGPYVTVSRLVPYKRIDLLIEAFRRMPSRKLVVVGDGPERRQLMRQLPSKTSRSPGAWTTRAPTRCWEMREDSFLPRSRTSGSHPWRRRRRAHRSSHMMRAPCGRRSSISPAPNRPACYTNARRPSRSSMRSSVSNTKPRESIRRPAGPTHPASRQRDFARSSRPVWLP